MNLIGLKAPVWDLIDTVMGTIVKDDGATLWIKIRYSKWEGPDQCQRRVTRTYVFKRNRDFICTRMGWS